MTEWRWEDAADLPPSTVERDPKKIASSPAVYIKGDQQHLHTRTSAETPGISAGNRASTLAPHSHDTREASLRHGELDSELHASFVRDNPRSFASESPGFLPLCESASVGPDLLYTAPEPTPKESAAAPAVIFAPERWVELVAGASEKPFETPCPERRGLVKRKGGAFLHFCVECGRWGAFGYGCTGDNPWRTLTAPFGCGPQTLTTEMHMPWSMPGGSNTKRR